AVVAAKASSRAKHGDLSRRADHVDGHSYTECRDGVSESKWKDRTRRRRASTVFEHRQAGIELSELLMKKIADLLAGASAEHFVGQSLDFTAVDRVHQFLD